MAVTGRRISGAEAAAWGLAQRCVPDGELDAAVEEICQQVVTNSWDTNRMMKKLYVDEAAMSRDAALKFERSAPYGMPRDMQERLQKRAGS